MIRAVVTLHIFTYGKAIYLFSGKFPEVNFSRLSFSPGEQVTMMKLYKELSR